MERDRNAENRQRTLGELLERAVVDVLAPVTDTAGQIMHRVEDWLESWSPRLPGVPLPDQFDLTRGQQLVTDLAQGMLTGELLEDSPSAGEQSVSTPCSDPETAQCDANNLHSQSPDDRSTVPSCNIDGLVPASLTAGRRSFLRPVPRQDAGNEDR